MPEARPEFEVTEDGQVGFGGGIDYDGEKKVRGQDLHDLVKAFLPSGLESLSLPSGDTEEDRSKEFFKDPIRHLVVISSVVRQHLSYKKSWDLPKELNGGVTEAKDIWSSGQGNCQAFSIVFASILKHFGVYSRMMSLTSPTLREDRTLAHPPHMVLMIHFPEEGFPSKEDNRHSERCSELFSNGLGVLEEYAEARHYTDRKYVGSRPFKGNCQRKLKWTHVSTQAKAAVRKHALPGHYLLHPPQQMVSGYDGLEGAGYLQKGGVCRFALRAIVRWSDAKDAPEEDAESQATRTGGRASGRARGAARGRDAGPLGSRCTAALADDVPRRGAPRTQAGDDACLASASSPSQSKAEQAGDDAERDFSEALDEVEIVFGDGDVPS